MSTAVVSTNGEFGVTPPQETTELAPSAAVEAARQEVQAAVILAKRFPRNEDEAFQRLIRSCKRPTFAADCEYSFPRGKTEVKGPTVYLAREFARVWGNIRHGCDVVADDDQDRTIRAWAWDLETNVKVTADVTFRKLIQRKKWVNNEPVTQWVEPDERDLRELTNKHAAIAKRNCLFELLPSDMVEDAIMQARETVRNADATDPDTARKKLIAAFGEINVTVENLESYLGHKIATCSPAEIGTLRTLFKAIKDGATTWTEAAAAKVGKSDDLAAKVQGETPPTPPKAKAATIAKLKVAIKEQQLGEQQVQAALAKLNLSGDPFRQSEADTLRLIDEIEVPAAG